MRRVWIAVILLVASGLACTLTSSESDATPVSNPIPTGKPNVTINQPTNGQTFQVGDKITIQAQASDTGSGVTRVELRVNNVIVDSQTSENPAGEPNLTVLLDYVAAVPSENLSLAVRAYRGITPSDDATITVKVVNKSTAGTTPTAGSNTTGGSTTGSTTGGSTTGSVPNTVCRARVDTNGLRLRAGPSTSYDILTSFELGVEVPLVGRLGDNTWWEVTSNNRRGWVSAAYTTLLGNCQNIPVTTPPASPTPVATNTSPAPQLADLTISTLSGSTNIILIGGQAITTYVVRVKNVGQTAAGAFNVTVFYPTGGSFDYVVQSLAPNTEVEIPGITSTFNSAGTYRLEVLADSSNNITESTKDNNRKTLDITVVFPTPTPEGQ